MAILVLGGAGFIGSHLVRELISAGRDVVVADNLATGFQQAVHPKARFYRTDIRDRAGLDHLFQREQIEGVIHFAAYSEVSDRLDSTPLRAWAASKAASRSFRSTAAERASKFASA